MRYSRTLAITLMALIHPVLADTNATINSIKSKIEIANKNEILSITESTKINDEVIYVDTLRFDDGAKLQLKAADRDAIYILAKQIRLSSPDYKATIEFYDKKPKSGANGRDPDPPLSAKSRSSGKGDRGSAGAKGHDGKPGVTRQLPTLYIITDEITYQRNLGDPSGFSDIRILVDGIDGGTGGKGGNGQDGQKGQAGRHGEANFKICSKGPRSGGDGGKGGDYGKGGKGANGGNGGNVVFIVSSKALDDIKDIRIRNRGGLPGLGGVHGQPGKGGDGGSRGKRPGTCDGGSAGSRGDTPNPPIANARSASGRLEGMKGKVEYIEYDDVASFFK